MNEFHIGTVMLLLSLLALTGCVSRDQADAKLAKGCAAAAETTLEEGFEIKQIIKSKFSESTLGSGFRQVTVTVLESDGWYEPEKDYKCIFAESFGFLNSNHDADIYQLDTGDKILGKKDDQIIGTFNDWLKLSNAVENAMGQ